MDVDEYLSKLQQFIERKCLVFVGPVDPTKGSTCWQVHPKISQVRSKGHLETLHPYYDGFRYIIYLSGFQNVLRS